VRFLLSDVRDVDLRGKIPPFAKARRMGHPHLLERKGEPPARLERKSHLDLPEVESPIVSFSPPVIYSIYWWKIQRPSIVRMTQLIAKAIATNLKNLPDDASAGLFVSEIRTSR
jgi:hypothetical protein